MPSPQPKRITVATFVLLGTVVGVGAGLLVGRLILLRETRAELASYATELVRQSDAYSVELNQIARAFNPSKYPFCSPQEISVMQTLAFRSRQVKDIGRTRDSRFYCSGGVGQLPAPLAMPAVTLVSDRGMRVYSNAPVMIAPRQRAIVLELDGVDMVISPTAYDGWERANMHFSVAVMSRPTRQMVVIGGDSLPVSPSWVLEQTAKYDSGVFYRAHCSPARSICIVTSQSASDMWAVSKPLLAGFGVMGGLAALGISLAISQVYLRQTGLAFLLRRAIRKDALLLVYQPILDLGTRQCVGAEALLRWSDEKGNPISPDFFVRIAEERGFVRELTALVIRRATQEMASLLHQYPDFTLSINIAAPDLEGEHLFSLLEEYVHQAGLAPGQIVLELTERSTGDMAVVRDAVMRLHRHGYKIHIDDFGTGFSSLSYLHELAVDAIKIDRSFTRTIGTDAVTASILPQILTLADSLQLDVIVEGVETLAQVHYLESTRRPMRAQGWYFCYPVSLAALSVLMENRQTGRETETSIA